jgi:ribonucleoside-diphosphate reductase alpha chain
VAEERPFDMPFPPHGERKRMPRRGGRHRGQWSLALRTARRAARPAKAHAGARRAVQRARSRKTGTDGTLSWTVDVFNPATGEDFVLA